MVSFNSLITIAVKLLICLFCIANHAGILPFFTSALKLNNSLISETDISERFLDIPPLFSSLSSLCIVAENLNLLDAFIRNYKVRNKIFTIFGVGKTLLDSCESIILIDIPTSDCEKIVSNDFRNPLYFISVFANTNVTELDRCLCNSLSSEAASVDIRQNSVLVLSNVFVPPRHFIKSNVENIAKHRVRSLTEDFGGIKINAAFMIYEPFTIVKHNSDKPGQLDGIEFLLVQELSQKLNFTVQHLIFDSWGIATPHGKWETGLFGAAEEGKADLVAAGIWQIYSLYNIIDFGPSIGMGEFSFMVRRPEQIDFEWRNFILIFKPIVWYATAAAYMMIMAFYWFGIIRGIPSYTDDWTCSVLVVFGHFTMTTSHSYFSSTFTRFILTSWSVFSLLLTTMLSTGIVCSLALPLYSPRVDTFKQLVEGGYYWTTQYYADFQSDDLKKSMFDFEDHWSNMFEKQYRYMDAGEIEATEHFDKKLTFAGQIFDNDLAIVDTDGLKGHKALMDFRMTREKIRNNHISFGVKKKSPLLEPLTRMTIRFLEADLLQQWESAVIRRWKMFDTRHMMEEYDDPTFGEPEALKLHKLRPVFYLLMAGLAAAFFVFCLENLWSVT